MGGDFSKVQEEHVREIREIAGRNYFYFKNNGKVQQVTKAQVRELLKYIWDNIPSYPISGSLKLETWRRVGEFLHQTPRAPAPVLITWRSVIEALQTQEQPLLKSLMDCPPPYGEVKVLPPQDKVDLQIVNHGTMYPNLNSLASAPSLPPGPQTTAVTQTLQDAFARGELEPDEVAELGDLKLLLKPLTETPPYSNVIILPPAPEEMLALPCTLCAPPSVCQDVAASAPVQGKVQGALAKAYQEGNLDFGEFQDLGGLECFPVTVGVDDQGQSGYGWEPLPLRVLRELKAAVKDYGLCNHYVAGFIQAVGAAHRMAPKDWKDLMQMIFTLAQYVVWDSQYQQQAIAREAASGRKCKQKQKNFLYLGHKLLVSHSSPFFRP